MHANAHSAVLTDMICYIVVFDIVLFIRNVEFIVTQSVQSLSAFSRPSALSRRQPRAASSLSMARPSATLLAVAIAFAYAQPAAGQAAASSRAAVTALEPVVVTVPPPDSQRNHRLRSLAR